MSIIDWAIPRNAALDVSPPFLPVFNSLRGREPNHFGSATCLNTSSREATGGAIGPSQLRWKGKLA